MVSSIWLVKICIGNLVKSNVKSNVKQVLCEQATLWSIYTEWIIVFKNVRRRAVEWKKIKCV